MQSWKAVVKLVVGAGEMAQQSRVLDALAQDRTLVPSTHIR